MIVVVSGSVEKIIQKYLYAKNCVEDYSSCFIFQILLIQFFKRALDYFLLRIQNGLIIKLLFRKAAARERTTPSRRTSKKWQRRRSDAKSAPPIPSVDFVGFHIRLALTDCRRFLTYSASAKRVPPPCYTLCSFKTCSVFLRLLYKLCNANMKDYLHSFYSPEQLTVNSPRWTAVGVYHFQLLQ